MRTQLISFNDIVFVNGENQAEWGDALWCHVGQTIYRTLGSTVHVLENQRGGRPITLTFELPWSWMTAETLNKLHDYAKNAGVIHSLVLNYNNENFVYTVVFRRDQGPLDFTPIDPRRDYFTGTLYLLEV